MLICHISHIYHVYISCISHIQLEQHLRIVKRGRRPRPPPLAVPVKSLSFLCGIKKKKVFFSTEKERGKGGKEREREREEEERSDKESSIV